MSVDDLTEFTWVDPTEMHLVKKPANGVDSPLLAKAAEALEAEYDDLIKEFVDGLCGVPLCGVCHDRYSTLKSDEQHIEKAKLKAKARNALSDSDFALPESREYPIHDANHARAALSMLHNASPEEQKQIKAAVHRRYPDIGEDDVEKEVSTDESLSQTHEVDAGPGPEGKPEAGDGGEPTHQEMASEKPVESDGGGDTAPDKTIPTGEALSQTNEIAKGDADADPGSSSWEHKDVALGEHAEALTRELEGVVQTFTEREKAEGGASKSRLSGTAEGALRQLVQAGTDLLEKTSVQKGTDDMDATELAKMLDERDERLVARFADVMKAKKKDKKAKMAPAEGEGAEDEATKAAIAAEVAKSEGAANGDLVKQVADLTDLVAKMAAEDGARPMLNGAGAVALLRDPEQGARVFKALEDRVTDAEARLEKSSNEFESKRAGEDLRNARFQLTAAKMVANENARERGDLPKSSRYGPNSTELFKNIGNLPEDTKLNFV
jgi:hypothetical protein